MKLKSELRKQLKLSQINETASSHKFLDNCLDQLLSGTTKSVAVYLPLKDEVNLIDILCE